MHGLELSSMILEILEGRHRDICDDGVRCGMVVEKSVSLERDGSVRSMC